jgi:hypothetical protein
MAKEITIKTLTGSSPYNIYLCTNTFTQCIWVAKINNTSIPYSFLVPANYENLSVVGVKIIDFDNCEIKNTINL